VDPPCEEIWERVDNMALTRMFSSVAVFEIREEFDFRKNNSTTNKSGEKSP
jgi:hypothetical protein